ncbi:hypothetical protein B0H14DRAFT_2603413 [Mycena olivaceomarginata]|nr:hypothetical protein B0H14DRAFT_2603413 [Mycena olivaceomarginata]
MSCCGHQAGCSNQAGRRAHNGRREMAGNFDMWHQSFTIDACCDGSRLGCERRAHYGRWLDVWVPSGMAGMSNNHDVGIKRAGGIVALTCHDVSGSSRMAVSLIIKRDGGMMGAQQRAQDGGNLDVSAS